jgi:hypothetical protein
VCPDDVHGAASWALARGAGRGAACAALVEVGPEGFLRVGLWRAWGDVLGTAKAVQFF